MQRDLAALVEGMIGGSVGTVPMSAVMMAGQKMGLLGTHPPELLSARALHIVGIDHDKETQQDTLAVVLHLGFGAAMGAVFSLLYRRLRAPLGAPAQGMVFASAVWAVSYKGWIPAMGIMPPPEHDHPGRPVVMVLAHWVYGWTLGRMVSATGNLLQPQRGETSIAAAA